MMPIQNRRRNKHAALIRGVLIVAALFLVMGASIVRESVTRALFAIMAPLWRTEQSAREGVEGRMSLLRSKQALREENAALREKNIFLTAELYLLPIIKKENQELKEILNMRTPEKRLLLARVLVGPGRSPYDTMIVDKGESDGIRAGDVATIHGDIAIGVVERAYAASSVVKLFSSPGEETDAFLGEENIPIFAKGMGGGNFKARVPKGVAVKEGDSVVSSAPFISLLGIVGAVQSAPSDSFQSVLFQIPINIYELKWAEILLESRQEEEEVESRK